MSGLNTLKKAIFTAVAFCTIICADSFALNLPVRIIGGKPYYVYTVDKKDRFYELPDKLGVSRGTILKYNPAAADGLQTGMVITIPVTYDAQIKDGWYIVSHEVKKGESIYGISKSYEVPVDRIIRFNPDAANGVHGLTLSIPVAEAGESESAGPDTAEEIETPVEPTGSLLDGTPYTIRPGDTMTSVAASHNVPMYEIYNVNPRLDSNNFVPGTIIIIPEEKSMNSSHDIYSDEGDDGSSKPELLTNPVEPEGNDIPDETISISPDEKETSTIVLMLPFSLTSDNSGKEENMMTEFYRGFLLGVEEQSHSGTPVTIRAYDSAVPADSIKAILASPEVAAADIIVAPDSEEIFGIIAAKAAGTDTKVFNPFVIRNTEYLSNPAIIQAIIPHERMYAKAVERFISTLDGKIPVFLSRIQGQADKAPFIALLKEQLDSASLRYIDLPYRDFLTAENLSELPFEDRYVFIPSGGSRIEFNKFAPALKQYKESGGSVSLFGFPEWITFRAETLAMMNTLGTTIYTRFTPSENDKESSALEKRYISWFGTSMQDAVPNQGVFGYDIAGYLLSRVRNNDTRRYNGVQTGFSFIQAGDSGGEVNDNLYFVTFLPDGSTIKESF